MVWSYVCVIYLLSVGPNWSNKLVVLTYWTLLCWSFPFVLYNITMCCKICITIITMRGKKNPCNLVWWSAFFIFTWYCLFIFDLCLKFTQVYLLIDEPMKQKVNICMKFIIGIVEVVKLYFLLIHETILGTMIFWNLFERSNSFNKEVDNFRDFLFKQALS